MDFNNWLQNPETKILLLQGAIVLAVLVMLIFIYRKMKRNKELRKERESATAKIKQENQALIIEIRNRLIDNLNLLSRIIALHPVVPGNTPDETTLQSRNRAACLSLIVEALPRDPKSQGIRMAEFIHQLSDKLVHAYGRDGTVNVSIDAQAIILDVDSAANTGLILNELISNALQYAPVPGERSKINIIFKERENKLLLSVGDNGTGMKSPYVPKFSFGLQLVNTLVQKHHGEMIITSRPGTRVEITLNEYAKAEREVYVTPTTRVY